MCVDDSVSHLTTTTSERNQISTLTFHEGGRDCWLKRFEAIQGEMVSQMAWSGIICGDSWNLNGIQHIKRSSGSFTAPEKQFRCVCVLRIKNSIEAFPTMIVRKIEILFILESHPALVTTFNQRVDLKRAERRTFNRYDLIRNIYYTNNHHQSVCKLNVYVHQTTNTCPSNLKR